MADFEVAPVGTRKLLGEIATTLRGYEAHHREKAAASGKDGLPRVETHERTEKADRNARLAGKVEALLAGWES